MKTYSRFTLESYGARDLLENAAEMAKLRREARMLRQRNRPEDRAELEKIEREMAELQPVASAAVGRELRGNTPPDPHSITGGGIPQSTGKNLPDPTKPETILQTRLTNTATSMLNTNRETENPKRPTATPTYVDRSGIIQDLSSQGSAEAQNPHSHETPQERRRPTRQRPAQNPNRPITTRNQIL